MSSAYWSRSESASAFLQVISCELWTGGWLPVFPTALLGGPGPGRAGKGSPFVAFSLGPVSWVSLCRNRAWSRGAVNTIFSAAQSPTSLPICCMSATLHGFETRPVYIPSDLASEPCKCDCIFTASLTLLFYGPSFSVSSFEAHFPSSFTNLKIIPWHSLRLWASGLKIFFPCSSLNLPPSLVIWYGSRNLIPGGLESSQHQWWLLSNLLLVSWCSAHKRHSINICWLS